LFWELFFICCYALLLAEFLDIGLFEK